MTVTSQDVRHPVFARFYQRIAPVLDRQGGAGHRHELLDGVAGRVIEVGAGQGLNFGHYPPAVTEVVAVEPEPRLRHQAEVAAERAPVPVRVVPGVADALPAETAAFDVGVASLVLCTVPDLDRALAELFRVIRPSGELRFYEHIKAPTLGLARAQQAVDAVWPRLLGGCHTGRDTPSAIEAAGFSIETCHRFHFPASALAALIRLHVIGSARRP